MDLPKTRLLVIDDDHLNRHLLVRTLEKAGFDVIDCADGVEALQILENTGPMLLVLDYEMPIYNGAQICELVRKHENPAIATLPIILLTAHTGEDHEVECLRAGADDFVTKPVNTDILKARIDTHLRLHDLRAQLHEKNAELENWRLNHERDLEAARITQQAILPVRPPSIAGWDVEAHYQPLIQVGGDVYDWLRMPDGSWLFWIADATGHGASAALLTTLSKLIYRHASVDSHSTSEILNKVNREFFAVFKGRSFMTTLCCLIRPGSGEISFAGAGHPPLFVVRTSKVESFLSQSPPIGILSELNAKEETLTLHPGDVALIYTDGLFSPMLPGPERERMTPDDLLALLPHRKKSAADFLKETVDRVISKADGAPLPDDLAAVALRFDGEQAGAPEWKSIAENDGFVSVDQNPVVEMVSHAAGE